MPMQRSPRDGHDHLRYTNDEDVDTRYPSNPRRVPRTNPSRPAPTTDGMSDEDVTRARTNYDTQGIISLESKPRPRPTNNRGVPARQPSGPYVKGPTQQSAALRRPTQQRDAVRQPTQQSAALRRPTQQRDVVKRPTGPRSTTGSTRSTSSTRPIETEAIGQQQFHWLVPVGVTMLIAIVCYLLLYGTWVGAKSLYNDWAYGAGARTYHLEAVVGDHDTSSPTHFIATNLHGTIDVIELPGGDITHAKAFPGPHLLWSNADRAVVTLEVKDVNSDKKPDIIVHVQGDTNLLFQQTTANFVLLNNGSGFSPMKALS